MKRILVTGAAGMIGSATVEALIAQGYEVIGIDRREYHMDSPSYRHYVVDLGDPQALQRIFSDHAIDRVIHMAALAHTLKGESFTPEDYRYFNVECAQNVFDSAGEIPVLFISTVDVYGFTRDVVDGQSPVDPVSPYALSKVQAEENCKKLPHYSIYRFSPVYTPLVKRDIQKRYYLKYPNLAYRIGKGTQYEILDIRNAVKAIVQWSQAEVKNEVRIIKDPQNMDTRDYIQMEKNEGRAKFVLYVPRWTVKLGYSVLRAVLGRRASVYLLHKAVYPLRSK